MFRAIADLLAALAGNAAGATGPTGNVRKVGFCTAGANYGPACMIS